MPETVLSSLPLAAMWAEVQHRLQIMGRIGTETVLDYWSRRCWTNGTATPGPGPPPGLGGNKYRPAAPEAGLLPQRDGVEPPGCG